MDKNRTSCAIFFVYFKKKQYLCTTFINNSKVSFDFITGCGAAR